MDEEELLQECKAQNSKLVNYLQQPRILKQLFEHVVGIAEVGGPGGRDWEEKVRFKYPYIASEVLSSDVWSVVDTALASSDEMLVPFWDAILSNDTKAQQTVTQHQHPLFAQSDAISVPGSPHLAASSASTYSNDDLASESSSTGVLGLEVKNDEGTTVTTARDNGPGFHVLAGYWAKVNGVFLDKKPQEMIEFIRSLPQVVELFVAHMETPAVVDLLYRIIQCEESIPNIGVVDWLSSEDLIPQLIQLLSPSHSADLHNTVSELLKAIIALSAPSPASLTQPSGAEAFGFGSSEGAPTASNGQLTGVNNRLVRELASEPIVRRMVSYMLDASLPTVLTRRLSEAADEQNASDGDVSKKSRSRPSTFAANRTTLGVLDEIPHDRSGSSSGDESALVDDELEFDTAPSRRPLNPRDTPASEQSWSRNSGTDHRDSVATIRPAAKVFTPVKAPEIDVTQESCTSTLVTCVGVLIELIRKNNSDYFEQFLFHTLRTHLLQRQQEIAEAKANKTFDTTDKATQDEEEDEMEGMEEAMAEISDKLGIVHLGPMLNVLCERLSDFQHLVIRPRAKDVHVLNSLGTASALTFERYRITELYAELLHCSNMALLNRAPGEGPQYSDEGALQGGIEGLQVLARTLQGADAASDSGQDESFADKTMAPSTSGQDVALEKESTPSSPPCPPGAGHSKQTTTTGGTNGSEDTDDEALLSEVSLTENAADDAVNTSAAAEISSAKLNESEDVEQDDEIRSVLSHLSLADLTAPSPSPSGPPSPIDEERKYVVGDLLKKKFLECDVIPTVLTLFFEYPWNNFLHNVVYDILQQFFNGRMDVGLNRRLTLAVFEDGLLTEKIVAGHMRNEESLKLPRKIRMGYMGHMNLIAEETVKLLERYPHEIAAHVQEHLTPEWNQFVEQTLREIREKEAAPLAGGRPQMMHSLSFAQGGVEGDFSNNQTTGSDAFANYLSSQMGGANASDDDDSDEDATWLSQDLRRRGASDNDGFDDAFEPSKGSSNEDDDDWGPFADASEQHYSVNSSAHSYLTPADLAADFQRKASARDDNPTSDTDDSSSSASNGDAEASEDGRARSNSGDSDSNAPFIDLLDSASLRQTDVVAATHARRPSLGQYETPNTGTEHRRRASTSTGSSDVSAANAADEAEPFGPGVSPDAQADKETGFIERTIGGETVKVPLDDVALAAQNQSEQGEQTESAVLDE